MKFKLIPPYHLTVFLPNSWQTCIIWDENELNQWREFLDQQRMQYTIACANHETNNSEIKLLSPPERIEQSGTENLG